MAHRMRDLFCKDATTRLDCGSLRSHPGRLAVPKTAFSPDVPVCFAEFRYWDSDEMPILG